MKGPAAPKDPVEKRPCLYVVLDKTISGTEGKDGVIRDYVFLEGRLKDQVKFTSGDVDEKILEMLPNMDTFRKLVHSVGVSIKAEDKEDREKTVEFQFQCYGKTDKYGTGTVMELTCPCNGEEYGFKLEDYPENEDDGYFGSFNLVFPDANKNMDLTVKFYLNDGYSVPEIQVDPPVNFESEYYEKLIKDTVISTGNNYRMKKVIEKAKNGEDVTIAYIGGSITQGAGAKPINEKCYAYHGYDAFRKLFGKGDASNIHYVKAGVGGTPSEFGMVRYENDVTDNGKIVPDLVIIEYAVNDEGDETEGVCFESLVKKVLQAENKPAVALMFAVFMSDWNLRDRLEPVGRKYNLPMVDMKEPMVAQFEENKVITKRQFFYDIYHPTNDGHRIMGDALAELFRQIDKEEADCEDIDLDVEPVYGEQFKDLIGFSKENVPDFVKITANGYDACDEDIQYVERDMSLTASPEYGNNWHNDGTVKDAVFKMELCCKNLVVVMKDSGSPQFGVLEFFVDGKKVKSIDPLKNGWAHCNAQIVFDEKEAKDHVVEFKLQPGDEGKMSTILAFGVTK